MQITNAGPRKGAAAPVLRTNSTARQAPPAAAGDHAATNDGPDRIVGKIGLRQGAGPPDAVVSVLRIQNAAPAQGGKTPALASSEKSMRRLIGPRGSAPRQDCLAAGASDGSLGSDKRAQRTKGRKSRGRGRENGRTGDGAPRTSSNKVKVAR